MNYIILFQDVILEICGSCKYNIHPWQAKLLFCQRSTDRWVRGSTGPNWSEVFKILFALFRPEIFLFFGPAQVFEVFLGPDPVDQNTDMDITLVPGVEVNLGPDPVQFEI